MGSGLILLVIVGAWLAVLVPMGLRSHDGAATSRSGERWSEAVRVLSRRSAAAPLTDEEPAHDDPAHDDPAHDDLPPAELEPLGPGWLVRLRGWRPGNPAGLLRLPGAMLRGAHAALADRRATRQPVSPAGRRRRVLLTLLGVAVLTAAAARVGPAWLLDVAGLSVVLALLFLVHCRRRAVARADRAHRRAYADLRREPEPVSVSVQPVQVLPVEPVEPVAVPVVAAPVVAAPAVAEPAVVRPARPAAGAPWQPVPVPLPTYVGKQVAPGRSAQVLEPDTWAPAETDDEQGVFEPRRVVSGW